MLPQTKFPTSHLRTSIFPTTHFPRPSFPPFKPITLQSFKPLRTSPCHRFSIQPLKCSVSVVSEPTNLEFTSNPKPFPAEVSRTIMELSSVGTFSSLSQEGWPLGFGVRFAVDLNGTPILCLNESNRKLFVDKKCSLHVQLEQSGLRTPQCTIHGYLDKPGDGMALKRLSSVWKKRFGEEVDENNIYVIAVERALQMVDSAEDGTWVTASEYASAYPDPLRDFAKKIIDEINEHNMEDVHRFCNIYVNLDFQVLDAKMVWVDRLGFDMRLRSTQNDVFEVRIPFPREVTDEKAAKSAFNGMSQLAWEVEKNVQVPEFTKVKQLKKIRS